MPRLARYGCPEEAVIGRALTPAEHCSRPVATSREEIMWGQGHNRDCTPKLLTRAMAEKCGRLSGLVAYHAEASTNSGLVVR